MSRRLQRVEELIKELLGKYIQENLTEKIGIIVITDVIVANDFKNAKVYVAPINTDEEKIILTTLKQHKQEMEWLLKKAMTIRYVPRLEFFLDIAREKIEKVEELLGEI